MNEYTGELSLYPCPVTLVTSKDNSCENVFTVSWTGIASSYPEYITIAIKKERFSHDIIKKTKKFCINMPTSDMVETVDYCGSFSGRDVNKFSKCNLKKSYIEDYIVLDDCPMSILCTVEHIIELGSHDLFISKVYKKYMSLKYETVGDYKPFVYIRPHYHQILKNNIGFYGMTKKSNIDR